MNRINANYFYSLGQAMAPLVKVPAGQTLGRFKRDAEKVERFLRFMEIRSTPIRFRLCVTAARRLKDLLDSIIRSAGDERVLHPVEVNSIEEIAGEFHIALKTELQDADIYYVPQVGIYSTQDLATHADQMFGENTIEIPMEIRREFNEGGRCLAFGLYTAAGFQLLRAVESAVRNYYDILAMGDPRPSRGDMGNYLNAIEAMPKADAKLVLLLRQIKDLHRNPVAHPGIVLNQADAAELLGLAHNAIAVILRIASTAQEAS